MKKQRDSFLISFYVCILLCFVLTACELGKKDQKSDENPAVGEDGSANTGKIAKNAIAWETAASKLPAQSREDLDKADRFVAFSNTVSTALSSGRYAQADVLMAYTKYYLAEWNLAKYPPVHSDEDDILMRNLVPPSNLFTVEEEKALAGCVQGMNKALLDMRANYRALEKYVEDISIQDDGAKGKQLGTSIVRAHAAYVAARDKYLGIVEARAVPAKKLLLHEHPLKRQIEAADNIFSVYLKAAELLALEKPDLQALRDLRGKLAENIETAGRPPFMAQPDTERAFREFLKQATRYAAFFDRGLNEGFHNSVRQDMNNAALASRAGYNDFVRVANRQH